MSIGIAIIGCGRIGRIRGKIASEFPGISWIGLCDINEELGNKLKKDIKADLFTTNYTELITRNEVDAVIIATSTTIGATLLYILAGFFFRETIKTKLAVKFSKLKEFFIKNDILYFTTFRFMGGGGAPYVVQNVLPLLFDMSVKNYAIATFVGSVPSMFVTVALGSGVQKIIDQNIEMSIVTVLLSPEIFIPLIGFFILLVIAFFIKKFYFKQ